MFKDLSWLQQVQCVINEQAACSNFTHTHTDTLKLAVSHSYIHSQTQRDWKLNIK